MYGAARKVPKLQLIACKILNSSMYNLVIYHIKKSKRYEILKIFVQYRQLDKLVSLDKYDMVLT
jgi:hypothetical protein